MKEENGYIIFLQILPSMGFSREKSEDDPCATSGETSEMEGTYRSYNNERQKRTPEILPISALEWRACSPVKGRNVEQFWVSAALYTVYKWISWSRCTYNSEKQETTREA